LIGDDCVHRVKRTEMADGLPPELGVVAAYGKLIPSEMLPLPRHGMINVHASLLPKYRGAAPVHRAVIDGDKETGVTIMRMVVALDAGAMLMKVVRRIDPDETSDVVERDLAHLGVAPLLTVIEQLDRGTVREEPQDDSQSTYAPRLTKDEGLIDWTLPSAAIHNRVRGLYPWPHAYTHASGARLIVLKSRVEEIANTAETAKGSDPSLTPGSKLILCSLGAPWGGRGLSPEMLQPMQGR